MKKKEVVDDLVRRSGHQVEPYARQKLRFLVFWPINLRIFTHTVTYFFIITVLL